MIERSPRKLAIELARKCRPRPRITGLDYVEKFGYVTSGSEGRQKWRTRPYQRDWFLGITDPGVQCMVCMKPSRVGWSEYVKLVIQFFCHWRPSKTMLVQPTDDEVKKYSDEELDNGLFHDDHGAPCLKGLLSNKKSRASLKNVYNYKQLSNGALIDLRHAGSPGSARRVNRNPVLLEEPAAYLQLSEGDTIQLFLQRAGTAVDPFFTIGGTPVYPNDYMEQCFLMGDQQYRYYPCPHCGHYQELMTRGAWNRFIKDGPDAGKVVCENCEEFIEYRHLRTMDEHAGWACPLGLDRSNQILSDDGEPIWRSQQVGPGMSYHRAASWSELARRYRNALAQLRIGNPDPMQTFHNTDMGIPWLDEISSRLTAEGLQRRVHDLGNGNGYAEGVCPNGVLLITVGVDVQGGGGTEGERLVAMTWGWGRGEEGWLLDWQEIEGDPQRQATLDQLDPIAARQWRREDGAVLGVRLAGIDEGGNATEEVRRWCSKRVGRWQPMKGLHQQGKPLVGKPVPVNFTAKGKAANRMGKDLHIIGVGYDASVTKLGAMLRVEHQGPGYLHVGMAATDQVLQELFPWKRVPKKSTSGARVYHWDKPRGTRDEAGDCTRYAYAAMRLVARGFAAGTMWEQLERRALASIQKDAPQEAARLLAGLKFG